jgi:hypothetical protein
MKNYKHIVGYYNVSNYKLESDILIKNMLSMPWEM